MTGNRLFNRTPFTKGEPMAKAKKNSTANGGFHESHYTTIQ
jgi:hypothetical protein